MAKKDIVPSGTDVRKGILRDEIVFRTTNQDAEFSTSFQPRRNHFCGFLDVNEHRTG